MAQSYCPIHHASGHGFEDCRTFSATELVGKEDVIKRAGLCFRCLGQHMRKECTENIRCESCSSVNHRTIMHSEHWNRDITGERPINKKDLPDTHAITLRSSTSKDTKGRSCGKTLLVDLWHESNPGKRVRTYAILDEESTSSFAHPKVFDTLGISGPIQNYRLTTLENHQSSVSGMIIKGLHVQGVNKSTSYPLPAVFENSMIPDTKEEIAEPHWVRAQGHLRSYADNLHPVEERAEVLLLIGRNAGNVMRAKKYGSSAPFAYDTALGWAIVGLLCAFTPEQPVTMRVLRTAAVHDHFQVRPGNNDHQCQTGPLEWRDAPACVTKLKKNVFLRCRDDEQAGPSKEDQKFMKLAREHISVNEDGFLCLKLPFKDQDPHLPNNRDPVMRRSMGTLQRMKKEPDVLEECIDAMAKTIATGKVESVPVNELEPTPGKAWWIPCFSVRHKRKGKIRLVFDSSASYMGTSLNNKLLQGPDHGNKLRGVLARFREGKVGFSCDIEAMFHMFYVPKEDRDFMRFFLVQGQQSKQSHHRISCPSPHIWQ